MSFKNELSKDMINTFLNTDEFAETVVYTPKGEAPREIKAIVNRRRIEPRAEDMGRVLTKEVELIVANDAEAGIVSVNKGQDEVSFPEVTGGPAISWIVTDILNQDEGAWHLLLQK